jgi:hypothetical protein
MSCRGRERARVACRLPTHLASDGLAPLSHACAQCLRSCLATCLKLLNLATCLKLVTKLLVQDVMASAAAGYSLILDVFVKVPSVA